MARTSPAEHLHDRAGAATLPYGPGEAGLRVVQTYGDLGLEYAAIRRSAALFDWPQHATLDIRGPERLAFLNRMVTQELKGLARGGTRRTFWLNRKGRVDADLTLIELGDRMLAVVDALAAERTVKGLTAYVITEDVSITDVSTTLHHLALHGRRSWEVLVAAGAPDGSNPIGPGEAREITIGGVPVVAVRDDACGEPGFELIVETARAAEVYARLLEFAHEHDADPASRLAARDRAAPRLRPAGWLAFNTARIEAGTPLYNIDFGPDSLPHESGVLRDRVSFTKGCYLGQEIVARMESRGHSKRTLVALRCEDSGPDPAPPADSTPAPAAFDRPMPVTGGGVYATGEAPEPIGTVTSATLSPMLGATPIGFAAVKPGHAAPGARLWVDAEGLRLSAVVQPTLRFLPS